MPHASWLRAWTKKPWLQRLSGLTLPPSTLALGVAEYISSLPVIPAKTTRSRASERATEAHASSPPKSSALPRSAGRIVSSERTSRGMRTNNSPLSSRHWRQWVTALRQEYSVRERLAPVTVESDFSSWPTATAVNRVRSSETMQKCADFRKRNANQNTVPLYLEEVATQWASPLASDVQHGGPNMRRKNGSIPLPAQTVAWTTPTATDTGARKAKYAQGGTALSMQAQWLAPLLADAGQKITHARHQGSLMVQAERNFPSLHRDQMTPDGEKLLPIGRSLNPLFVEWLMAWPIGWTDLGSAVTEFTLWQQRMRTLLWTLCTPSNEQKGLFDDIV